MSAITSLRVWLRKEPQPKRLRVRTVDDQERLVDLDPDVRRRWKIAEEAVMALRGVAVECLDREENVIRARDLTPPDEETGISTGEGASDILAEKLNMTKLSNERKEFALAIDRYGAWAIAAYKAGADAASEQQDKLVGLVEILTNSLNTSIVNLHAVSGELARERAEAEDPEPEAGAHGVNGQQLMALMAAGLLKDGVLGTNGTNGKGES